MPRSRCRSACPCKEDQRGLLPDVLVIGGALHVLSPTCRPLATALPGAIPLGLVHAQMLYSERQTTSKSRRMNSCAAVNSVSTRRWCWCDLMPAGAAEYINCGHVRPLRQCGQRIEDAGERQPARGLDRRARVHVREPSSSSLEAHR